MVLISNKSGGRIPQNVVNLEEWLSLVKPSCSGMATSMAEDQRRQTQAEARLYLVEPGEQPPEAA